MQPKHSYTQKDHALLNSIHEAIRRNFSPDMGKFQRLLRIKFGFYLIICCISYAMLFHIQDPVWFIATFIAYGFCSLLFAFNFAHDFSHNTIFKNDTWNHFAFIGLYTMVGAHAEAWKERHINSHHFAPNVKDHDTDLQITSLIRVVPGSTYKWYHRFQHFYAPLAYTTYSFYWIFIKDFVVYTREILGKAGWKQQLSFWLQKITYSVYIFLLPALFAKQPLAVMAVALLLMHLLVSLFLLFTFFMTHHVESTRYPKTGSNGNIQSSWLMNQIKSSNDMHPFSKTANFILGGFNNHIAHHIFPHIHHIHYPELNRVLYGVLRENNIEPNQTTYWGGVVSHLKLLRQRGTGVD